jgi:hypothetical protein
LYCPPSIPSIIKLTSESLKKRDREHLKNKIVEGRIALNIDLKGNWFGNLLGYQIVLSMGE